MGLLTKLECLGQGYRDLSRKHYQIYCICVAAIPPRSLDPISVLGGRLSQDRRCTFSAAPMGLHGSSFAVVAACYVWMLDMIRKKEESRRS